MTFEQVRPVLACFSQILSFYDFSPISPETFWSAKFDRPEATQPLWRLIFEMIHFNPDRTRQERSRQIFDQTSKDELIDTIKADLYQRGYAYDHVLYLDNEMEKGSRALLVCLGWLIYHLRFIERCLGECLKSIPPQDQKQQTKTKKKKNESPVIRELNQAILSNGKVRSHLHDLGKQRAANEGSLEQQSMSPFDLRLCQHPEFLSECLTELEGEHQQLNALLVWHKNENIFWKWMESVLDQPPASPVEKQQPVSTMTRQRLEAEREKFNATIDTLDDALVRLEQLWLVNEDRRSMEQDFSAIIASIDGQISTLFNQLLDPPSSIPHN